MEVADPPQPGTEVSVGHPCIRCGYDLAGLSTTAICPECAVPVERSLRGDLIEFSDPEYRRSLMLGVTLVMVGMVTSVVLMIGTTALMLLFSFNLPIASPLLSLGATATSLFGYYLYSAPDPGQLSTNKGETPRRVLRLSLIASAAITIIPFLFRLFPDLINPISGPGLSNNFMWVALGLWFLGLVITAVQFYAAMLYTQWLAPRLPDARVLKRAKRLMWLGPLLYILGFGIGQIVVFIMYFVLFLWIRRHLARIQRNEQALPQSA